MLADPALLGGGAAAAWAQNRCRSAARSGALPGHLVQGDSSRDSGVQ